MDHRIQLQRAMMDLLRAPSAQARQVSAEAISRAALDFAASYEAAPRPEPAQALERDKHALALAGDRLDEIDDTTLDAFNKLLPWAAMTTDRRGRIVGGAWSNTKRANFGKLIDNRIREFDRFSPLKGKHVLEIGCFEGIHTLGCLLLGARVTGVDGRIENIVKTMARLWAYGQTTPLLFWDLEGEPPYSLAQFWDVLHHIGVLYHLTNPVEHLDLVLPRTKQAIILDTHVAFDDEHVDGTYTVAGRIYRYQLQQEAHTVSPFAGLRDHAKWLRVEDLEDICRRHGFADIRRVEDRNERNGRRVLLWAFRESVA
ncbi:tRNA U34 carboxymethyltransferase [Methylorubrum suomiense]|uniref:tRNA U34 carboxymethyltransferase n=3 Tax=Methylorubrum suomiense TaxID=144191 RepID=A0ABQ4V0U8_9HYPH|nr:tRNA U34 carboxymethyltransferase [Methylorubrum suomiense]